MVFKVLIFYMSGAGMLTVLQATRGSAQELSLLEVIPSDLLGRTK